MLKLVVQRIGYKPKITPEEAMKLPTGVFNGKQEVFRSDSSAVALQWAINHAHEVILSEPILLRKGDRIVGGGVKTRLKEGGDR